MTGLKGSSVRFHPNPKLVLIVTASYALLSFLLVVVIVMLGNNILGRLITLNKCDYQYSATMEKSIGQDDYYLFEAAIGFTRFRESSQGINAEVMMQTTKSDYIDLVNWSVDSFLIYEVAISADVARAYGLTIGSALYSKHIVDGNVYEYTVTQLLPYFPGTGISLSHSYAEGVIIMGYDSRYDQNISHTTIFFTNDPIIDLTKKFSETPINIVYRDDMIATIQGKLVPYLILIGALGIVLTLAFSQALMHMAISDYKRFIMIGFRKHDLSRAFCTYNATPFVLSVFCTAALSAGMILLLNISLGATWFLIILLLVELITFIITSFISKWRVWRS